jgi:hypothetical protein
MGIQAREITHLISQLTVEMRSCAQARERKSLFHEIQCCGCTGKSKISALPLISNEGHHRLVEARIAY